MEYLHKTQISPSISFKVASLSANIQLKVLVTTKNLGIPSQSGEDSALLRLGDPGSILDQGTKDPISCSVWPKNWGVGVENCLEIIQGILTCSFITQQVL